MVPEGSLPRSLQGAQFPGSSVCNKLFFLKWGAVSLSTNPQNANPISVLDRFHCISFRVSAVYCCIQTETQRWHSSEVSYCPQSRDTDSTPFCLPAWRNKFRNSLVNLIRHRLEEAHATAMRSLPQPHATARYYCHKIQKSHASARGYCHKIQYLTLRHDIAVTKSRTSRVHMGLLSQNTRTSRVYMGLLSQNTRSRATAFNKIQEPHASAWDYCHKIQGLTRRHDITLTKLRTSRICMGLLSQNTRTSLICMRLLPQNARISSNDR
jgi:hypothetical protein